MPEIFVYDFMRRAFLAAFVIGIVAPMIGVFLVQKRYSLLADTLAHISLVGVAIASVLNISPVLGALVASSAAGVGIDHLRIKTKIFGEAVLALFLSGSLAFALIIFAVFNKLNSSVMGFLFGSISTVSPSDLWLISGFGIAVFLCIALLFKKIFLITLDEELAQISGLKVSLLNASLMLLAGITTALSMRAVGTLLVGALMVIPTLTAANIGKSFIQTFWLAVAFSLFCSLGGLTLSFYLNLPSGPSTVVLAVIVFLISLILPIHRKILSRN